MSTRIPQILYHYCSLQTFKSILENRSIWLSDVSKSNDSRELSWIKSQCVEKLIRSWLGYLKVLEAQDKFTEVGQQHFAQFDEARNLVEHYNASKCWTFCLSEKKDDLGQWRGYADDGRGVAIGFDSRLFEVINVIAERLDKETDLRFRKISYLPKDRTNFFDNTCRLSQITAQTAPDDVIDIYQKAVGLTIRHAPFFKHEKFRDEKEWRLAYSMPIMDVLRGQVPSFHNLEKDVSNLVSFGKLGYTIRNNDLVSHVELKLPPLGVGIKKIILGPKCAADPFEIRMLLASLDYDALSDAEHKISIIRSEASYR